MSKITLNELHKEILQNLTKKDFLQKISLTEEKIQMLVLNKNFVTKLSLLISKGNITCKNILDLSNEIFNSVSQMNNKDWLFYVYEYILDKSFPNAVSLEIDPIYENAVLIYLEILRTIFNHQKKSEQFNIFKYMDFLNEEEIHSLSNSEEYKKFIKVFNDNYMYELMRLSQEIYQYNTLEHISGVHYVALHIGRQLYQTGLPIDLGLVSGAAAGHDIGKYGCVKEEVKRVPYLHYYYTDMWFKKFGIPNIGHIAVNHSTWDLELENLPLESLILIYADFRVKNKTYKTGNKMHVFSLEQSFDIILGKLDNLDDDKKKRYERVYSKLKDFEDFMINQGVNTDLSNLNLKKEPHKDYALLNGNEVVESFKFMAIKHNITLMNKLSRTSSFTSILEAARSENNWKSIRAYLNIFEEYSTYMTQKQKILTLNFLYELLIHREGDIRRQSAELLGKLIVEFDEEYRKEVPKNVKKHKNQIDSIFLWRKYLDMIIYPDHKTTDLHKEWIGYALKIFVKSAFDNCDEMFKVNYIEDYLKYFDNNNDNDFTYFILLDSLLYVPINIFTNIQLDRLVTYSLKVAKNSDIVLKLTAVNYILCLSKYLEPSKKCFDDVKIYLEKIHPDDEACINYLKYKTATQLQLSEEIINEYNRIFDINKNDLSNIFLNNLKTATPWLEKIINIDFILEHIKQNPKTINLHTATHFSNLTKVSAKEAVRNKAGKALLEIAPLLTSDQRNDITIELLKGLDIESVQHSKYIPEYLGQFALFLPPKEINECIDDINNTFKESSLRISTHTLNTLGVMVQHYSKYKDRFEEDSVLYIKRYKKLLGIILSGLANYNEQIKQEAFLVIGKNIFGSTILSLEEKCNIFKIIHKKLLTLLSEKEINDLFFFNNAASLNHIYRFISDYSFYNKKIDIKHNKKVAFFPGTFDPFSLSHKGIVEEIKNLGFEVFLSVDEFSWSKHTQPRLLRRQIINMSIADEFDIYLFPDNISINLSNNNDLKYLESLFTNKDIYIVVGSDVIVNASSYKARISKDSIHNFNHIIFLRSRDNLSDDDIKKSEEAKNKLKGEVIELRLPVHLEEISSTQIREHIDQNRDISNLIEPLAQKFIYEYSLYLKESQFKTIIKTKSLNIELVEDLSKNIVDEIGHYIFMHTNLYENIGEKLTSKNINLLVIRDSSHSNKLIGFSAFHQITTTEVFSEFKSSDIANYVRQNTSGKIIIIDGIYTNVSIQSDNLEQIIITETLAHCLKNDFTYALYRNVLTNINSEKIFETLELQGFIKLEEFNSENPIYAVDMKSPICLTLDLESFIKAPLNTNTKVLNTIHEARKKLQTQLTRLYPGNLVLSFDKEMLNHNLTDKICSTNNVASKIVGKRVLGKYMCVPFGNILKGTVVPNTVTKSLHTDKIFNPDIRDFKIGMYPFYSSIENQVRTIKSFDRPVILVDDLLHKGYRMKAIDPILKHEHIKVGKIIVGLLSGRGKDLMEIQEREVDSAYFIPNLRLWFNENLLYPFIGGDTVWRNEEPNLNLIPSINLILPYVSPHFIKDTSNDTVYDLSMTCLQNAKDILKSLETEYQVIYEKNLTLKRLSEVMLSPRYPDMGKNIEYDLNKKPSSYIQNDIERLIRLERTIK